MTNKFTRGTITRAYVLSEKAISVDVTFDSLIKVYGLKIMKGKNGVFLAMPSVKGKDGKYYSSCYFEVTPDCQTSILTQAIDLLGEPAAAIIRS